MKKIEFCWKPAKEAPTKRWSRNNAISPLYLVKCGTNEDGVPILGYSNYSFVTNEWIDCFEATERGLWKVEYWTDVKL